MTEEEWQDKCLPDYTGPLPFDCLVTSYIKKVCSFKAFVFRNGISVQLKTVLSMFEAEQLFK